jgi:hypothetical protein
MSVFFVIDHDWDMDAFLYIGSRLWHGELLYLYDFETKLPALQYLFSLPSALGGIGAWRFLTALFSGASGLWASHILARTLKSDDFSPISFGRLRLLCLSFFLLLLYSLPGSESAHIEMVSASLAFVSLALMLEFSVKRNQRQLFLSGVFLAMAASIRPNYAYVLPFSLVCLLLFDARVFFQRTSERRNFVKTYLRMLVTLNLGFFGVVLLFFIPYFFVASGVPVLVNSLNTIASASDGIGIMDLFRAQRNVRTLAFYLSLYLACGMLLLYFLRYNSIRYKNFKKLAFLSLACILAINTSLLQTHYFAHYTIMFVPYAVPVLILIFLSMFKGDFLLRSKSERLLGQGISFVLCLVFLLIPAYNLLVYGRQIATSNVELNTKINDRRIDYKLLIFLQEQNQSFLVVRSPIYHMLLGESRIGDGHPAMLRTVLSGKRLGPVGRIYLYSDEVFLDPCLSLIRSGKQVIVAGTKSELDKNVSICLDRQESGYKKTYISNLDEYTIFIRQ